MDHNPPTSFPAAQSLEVTQVRNFELCVTYKSHLHEAPSSFFQQIHFGNITLGVATQCLKGNLARGSNPQYWANVCLKINAKLGGVNTKLNIFDSPSWIFDPSSPVMIIATHVRHPPPGTRGLPSFAGAVASLDSSIARYTALNTAQDSHVEMIQGLESMVYELIAACKRHGINPKITMAADAMFVFSRRTERQINMEIAQPGQS
ncbi:unnamed protein product [Rhizoctonia solani]|uniref:Piwi domain-containing protein n=1 Tax=Rhizoctonia solani TaxID=456999 RepID=A0A8H3CI36_9AGAM|nr:unnamed protein product [Rhizoctonia solani]